MNDFGPEEGKRLEWVATKPTTSVAFLDLTVRITDSGEIATTTFQKAYNLYLYRPPTSAQPESTLYNLINLWNHASKITNFRRYTERFSQQLTKRALLRTS